MYTRYRQRMTPILESYGGLFRYDFRIAEVLESDTDDNINRLFVISFPDTQSMEEFFSNEEYLKVKREFFEPAVESITTVAEYDVKE